MSFLKDSLPVYTAAGELLYYASFAAAERLLQTGRAEGRGTRRRVRSLVAMCGTEESLRADHLPSGQRYSHNHETPTNPRGVWTHATRRCLTYGT